MVGYPPQGLKAKAVLGRIIYEKESTSETLTANVEKEVFTIEAEGNVLIALQGDGDPNIKTRIYCDGELFEVKGTSKAILPAGFSTSLKVYHFSSSTGTYTTNSLIIMGWRK